LLKVFFFSVFLLFVNFFYLVVFIPSEPSIGFKP